MQAHRDKLREIIKSLELMVEADQSIDDSEMPEELKVELSEHIISRAVKKGRAMFDDIEVGG